MRCHTCMLASDKTAGVASSDSFPSQTSDCWPPQTFWSLNVRGLQFHNCTSIQALHACCWLGPELSMCMQNRYHMARQFVPPGRLLFLRPLKTTPRNEPNSKRKYQPVWIESDVRLTTVVACWVTSLRMLADADPPAVPTLGASLLPKYTTRLGS